MIQNRAYNGIDALKFMMAIMVVILHSNPWRDICPLFNTVMTQCVTRLAVPFFFVAAGFLLFRKMPVEQVDTDRIRRYVMRILRMYLIWTAIYLPLILYFAYKNKHGVIVGLLLKIDEFFFAGSYFHLWFLPSLGIAAVLLGWLLIRGWSWPRIFFLAFAMNLIVMGEGSYHGLYLLFFPDGSIVNEFFSALKVVFRISANGLTIGLLYVSAGAWLAWYPVHCSMRRCYVFCFISLVAVATEFVVTFYWLDAKVGSTYIALIPTSILLFIIAMRMDWRNRPIFLWMRRMSMFIYFIHPWLLALFGKLDKIFFLGNFKIFVVVLISSVILSVVIIALSRKFKLLKILY